MASATRPAPSAVRPLPAPPAAASKPAAQPKAAPRPRDLRPALRSLGRRLAVALAALAGLLSLLAGTPAHVAAGRGLAAWFLTLALARLVRALAGSSPARGAAERAARPAAAPKP